MRAITILLVLLLSVLGTANAQNFGNCTPGYVTIVVGDGSPGNPIGTYTNVPKICSDSSNISQPGLIPVGTHVRFTPPQYTGSTGQRIGRVEGVQWSWFPDKLDIEIRYTVRFTPDAGFVLDTAALLPSEFEVVGVDTTFSTSFLTNLYTYVRSVLQS